MLTPDEKDETREVVVDVIKEVLFPVLESLATKEDFKKLATKEELQELATQEELKKLATKEDLEKLATKEDLTKLRIEVNQIKTRMVTKNDLKPFAKQVDDHEKRIIKLETDSRLVN